MSSHHSELQQLSPEQEAQISEWVSEERGTGAIIRKELIHWFATRLAQRDGSSLAPGFVDNFLARHPAVTEDLLTPPHPRHDTRKTKPVPKGPFDRMKEKMEQDRRKALFRDSPPPERNPAPYPEGEIIHHLFNRYVVRHGDNVTKYTTHPDGMSVHDQPNEALALRFVQAHTTIPVPKVISCDWDRIEMEYIDGQPLQQAWPVLTSDERSNILHQLGDYIRQLHTLRGIHIGRLSGEGALLPTVITRSGGPFKTVREFHDWLARPRVRETEQAMFWHQITTQLGTESPIVFTHSDLAARNILVRDGNIVAIIDWEMAGWYPEYWEYVWALQGMDNVDWETLGSSLPSLFTPRYDHEYILVHFLASVS